MRYKRRILTGLAATACVSLSVPAALATPAPGPVHTATPVSRPSRPANPPHDTITRKNAHGQYRRLATTRPAPGPYGQQFWAGDAVTADSGKSIYSITGDITIPTIDCSDTYIGSSGFAMLYDWIGIDGYGTSDVEQDGIEAYCSGTPGELGSGSAAYAAWYIACCQGGLQYFSPPSGTLAAGKPLQFQTQWLPSTKKYQFVLRYGANYGSSITEDLSCPSGQTCGTGTAEAIMEQPGGELPAFPMPQWTASSGGSWSGLALVAGDGTKGTLNALANEWTASGTLYMSAGSPIEEVGSASLGPGWPAALDAGGDAFTIGCVYAASEAPIDWTNCPTAPWFGVDWSAVIPTDTATPDYIVGNGHQNRVTWTTTASSGTDLMPEYLGTASDGNAILRFYDGPRNLCLDDVGSNKIQEESCPAGDTEEEWEPEVSTITYSGDWVLKNVSSGLCMEAVTGTGNYLDDVTCPAETGADSWNVLWFTG